MEFFNSAIPYKDGTVRPSDKPWYETEIRKYSRKRDRLKSKAIKSSSLSDWNKYKTIRNKVNNLKTHAKETFYNNLELSLLTSYSNNKKEFGKLYVILLIKRFSVNDATFYAVFWTLVRLFFISQTKKTLIAWVLTLLLFLL